MTMLLFETDKPKKCGIVKINKDNVLIDFKEKPNENIGNLANAAIYIISKKMIKDIKTNIPLAIDFSLDVIPSYINQIYTYKTNNKYIDIGSYDQYIEAQNFKL